MTTTVYCAGPIKETDDPHTWRNELQELAHEDIELLNPLDKYDGSETTPSADGPPSKEIIYNDLLMIDQADAVLVYHPEACETWGTPMEVLYARQSATVVALGWGSETVVSPWGEMATYISDSYEDCLRYIEDFFHHRSKSYPPSGKNVELFSGGLHEPSVDVGIIRPEEQAVMFNG